jgi:A/G-specific adenine glycosylase
LRAEPPAPLGAPAARGGPVVPSGGWDVAALLAWFEPHGRRHLPWREEPTPYRVIVSEFMLQQTQVERVLPIFERFVAAFPSFEALAGAPQADVVRAWRGLGYNSRALRLHQLALAVCDRFGGELPREEAALLALPGIGPYTARAVLAFAFNQSVAALDTNVRRIVHRTHFGLEFPPVAGERALDAVASAAVPAGRGSDFNSALMDLGSSICGARIAKCLVCPLRPECAAAPVDAAGLAARARRHPPRRTPQERLPFEATTRFVRGRILDRLRALAPGEAISALALETELATLLAAHPSGAVGRAVDALEHEGLVQRLDERVRLR